MHRTRPEVFVIAGVRLYQEGLSEALRTAGDCALAGSARDGRAALERLRALDPPPRVVLLDVGVSEGPALVRRLRAAATEVKVVALAVGDNEADAIAWAEAGVDGLVSRDASLQELHDTIAAVDRGVSLCTPATVAALLRHVAATARQREHGAARASEQRAAPLTRREREIVGLIGEGLSNKEIGRRLHIELSTVKNHVHRVLEKLDVRGRRDAAAVLRDARPAATGREI